MLHRKRVFKISEETDVEELARKLVEHTWCLCNGFKITIDGQTLHFFNDSISEDGAQEYAAFLGDKQVESITFGWVETIEEGARYIRECLELEPDAIVLQEGLPSLEHPQGSCHLCR